MVKFVNLEKYERILITLLIYILNNLNYFLFFSKLIILVLQILNEHIKIKTDLNELITKKFSRPKETSDI